MKLFWIAITRAARILLSLRYRIEIKGLDLLSNPSVRNNKNGIFFMPNHPALVDPMFLAILLWPKFRMRPLVTEYIYRQGILKIWMKLSRAICIPSLTTTVNAFKVKKAKEAIQEAALGLSRGDNFLLYPSGRLKHTGYEVLGGSSGAHDLLQNCPDAQVVLIRTSGLWGSSFSRAILGVSPDLKKTVWHGLKAIFKNGIFFTPRRKILIEIELAPADFPRHGSRLELNRFLEEWYNRYQDPQGNIVTEEPLTLVSYAFWKKDIPEITPPKHKNTLANSVSVSQKTVTLVTQEIRKILNNPTLTITPEQKLTTDLGFDSLNVAEMIAFLIQKFDVTDVHPEDLTEVQDVFEIAEHAEVRTETVVHGKFHFPEEGKRKEPSPPMGKTIPEAFLRRASLMGSSVACGDDMIGVMRYSRLKKAALVLASYFKTLPETHVAILLPASCGAYLLIFALQLAGKTPVMLNWTLGPRYLDDMMRLSGAKRVLSSWKFVEKLAHVDFGATVTDQIVFLEDVRAKISLKHKIKGLFLSLLPTSVAMCLLKLDQVSEDAPAVILFTSGTEASPKGVPLSHKNILTNQTSAFNRIILNSSDILFGILPPFHSFGFSVVGLFPLLAGIRVAFSPDPTDSVALAEGVSRWKVTLFCGAPNFLKGLFAAAKPEQLKSIRIFISGAEKPPTTLLQTLRNLGPNVAFLEGYGITECSPILSATKIGQPSKGVGCLLEGIEGCTIHPETHVLLPPGQEGELCVRGPNVFHGYLGTIASPFIEIDGKQWYRTGDIAYFEKSGNLILSGRLKRFTKLGGEMVSLGAIEDILNAELIRKGQSSDAPLLAVCAIEKPDQKPEIVVFTTSDSLDKATANAILTASGCSRLIKVSQVQHIPEMPLLGTGKTNYRHLQSLLNQA